MGHADRPARGQPVHLVTQAQRSRSDDIAYRQRRYLWMMGIRAACFVVAVIMFVNHLGWLTAVPVVGAIFIPYFAVVFANAGREPNNTRGFMEYRPNVPTTREDTGRRDGDTGPARPTRPGTDDN